MIENRNDDWLDRQLREDARAPLEDLGFTNRVMSALPPAAERTQTWLKPALVLSSTALGGFLATVLAPVGPMVIEGARQLGHFHGFTPAIAMLFAMTAILAVAGYILAED